MMNISLERFFFYLSVPVAEMRNQPSSDAEVVSQAFFSEQILLLEQRDGWIKIETCVDNYQGWVKDGTFCKRSHPFPKKDGRYAVVTRNAAHLYRTKDTIYGPMATLPFESRLEVLSEDDHRWCSVALPDGRHAFIQKGDVCLNRGFLEAEEISALSMNFLGLPYTWGGRSSFGYDCSGFVQMLFRQRGIYLPRDSKDQFHWKELIAISPREANPGDLVFFGKNEKKPCHVGMCLGGGRFIHACAVTENAPYIRINHLTDDAWNGSGYYPYCEAKTLF